MISVVMMSYLGDYPGSRTNPIEKFNRAVQSIIDQTYENWELIIVSDGCELTNQEYLANWSNEPRIKLIKTEKSKSKWPGTKRQIGVNQANGEWVCYLDSDDLYLPNRLTLMSQAISKYEVDVIFDTGKTVVFNASDIRPHSIYSNFKLTPWDVVVDPSKSKHIPELGDNIYYYQRDAGNNVTGTWCVFHKRDISTKWQDSHKTGEDTDFIRRLKLKHKHQFVNIGGYIIRHSAVRGWDI